MSNFEQLLRKTPWLIGAKNPERWFKVLFPIFEEEKRNPDSVFAAKPRESIRERLEVINSLFSATGADEGKTLFIVDLIYLKAHTCAIAKGRQDLVEDHETLHSDILTIASVDPEMYAEILSVMSIEEAATNGEWD